MSHHTNLLHRWIGSLQIMKIVKRDMVSEWCLGLFFFKLGEFGQKLKLKIKKFKNVVILEVFNC
jgi:hypothetical protein